MLYSDVLIKEPAEKIADDWDFLDEKVIRKFSGFRPVGDNIYGIRAISHDTAEDFGEKAEQFPRLPPGTMIQSGTSQFRPSRMRYMMVFWPSRRKGLTEFIR